MQHHVLLRDLTFKQTVLYGKPIYCSLKAASCYYLTNRKQPNDEAVVLTHTYGSYRDLWWNCDRLRSGSGRHKVGDDLVQRTIQGSFENRRTRFPHSDSQAGSAVGWQAPVIYLLDGNALFGEVADMVITNGYFGDTAPAYVVGIGYPNEAFSQWLSLRNHDLVHVHVPDDVVVAKGSGRALSSRSSYWRNCAR